MHLKAISRVGATHWFLPAFTLALGLALGGAQWIGGDAQTRLTSMVFFLAIAAVFFWGGRSETIRMIRGDGRDERWARIDLAAAAITGPVTILVNHRCLGVGARPRRQPLRLARRTRGHHLRRLSPGAPSPLLSVQNRGL